jgi:hypothetical protein
MVGTAQLRLCLPYVRCSHSIQQKTRGARAFLSAFIQSDFVQYGLVQAACLCIAPVAETCPRIALTERSIAAQSLPISAAARPSA